MTTRFHPEDVARRMTLSHRTTVKTAKGYFTVDCNQCDFGHGPRDWRDSLGRHLRFDTRSDARDAADAHMLFTHVTGGKSCGEKWCAADQVVQRLLR